MPDPEPEVVEEAPVAVAPVPAKRGRPRKTPAPVPQPEPDNGDIEEAPAAAEVPEISVPARYAKPEPAPVSRITHPAEPSGLDDVVEVSDLQIPGLNLVQGVGPLAQSFYPGQFVLGKSWALNDPPAKAGPGGAQPESEPTIFLVILGFQRTRFSERISGGERGRIFRTEQEVIEAGGTLSWNLAFPNGAGEQAMPYFQRLASAVVLVAEPEGFADRGYNPEEAFSFCAEEVRWAIAGWHLRGSGFTNAAMALKTARSMGWLKSGYPSKFIQLTTRSQSFQGGNLAFIPVVRPGGNVDAATAELVSSITTTLLGGSAGESVEAVAERHAAGDEAAE